MPAKRLFQPPSTEELLRGWVLHAHKGRDRHDETARRLDRTHRWLGILTALFAALAGTSFFAAQAKQAPASLTGYLAAGIGFVAAVLASIQTAANFAGRAEAHRVAGVSYKALIRKLELLMSEHSRREACPGTPLDMALRELEKELDALEAKAPVVPSHIHRYIDAQYTESQFVDSAVLLNKQVLA